ncbi:hypothetical protein C2S51_031582 [Perilla frutescens var. frutescens]|nr:hypothetical protein C2S51_031582 [Perilla frutescens var. frutescens]
MDTKILLLEEAARHGKLDILEKLVKENPAVLADFKLKSLGESLLHQATKCRQPSFVRELMKIDPDVAGEVDKDGFRPLDIAVIMGDLVIVREILSFNKNLCMLKGKDGRTALHYAAMKGRTDVIDALLSLCPDSIEDVTVRNGETALHLAVKNHQFDAFIALVRWAERLNKESMINKGDDEGNTVLHVAVLTKQYACIDVLLAKNSRSRGTIDVNARNGNGSTALDVLQIEDSYDIKINQMLENLGAVRSPDDFPYTTKQSKHYTRIPKSSPKHDQSSKHDWFTYFKFQMQRDSPSDTRNALLVVAALIATVCFTAGLQPPKGIIIDKPPPPSPPPPPEDEERSLPGAVAGVAAATAILGSYATSLMFLFANSLGFTSSTCIIIYLTSGFPFQRELHMALYSMMFSYGFAVISIVKDLDKKKEKLAYGLLSIAFALPFALRWLPRWGSKAWNHWRNRNARLL